MDKIKELQTKLVRETALRLKQFDDAYPDVGMGYSWSHFVQQAMQTLQLSDNDVDMNKLKRPYD